MNTDETTCPHCAEIIKSAAKLCKHCGQQVDGAPAAIPFEKPSDPIQRARMGAVAAIGGIFVLLVTALVAHNAQGGSSSQARQGDQPQIENASDATVAAIIANAEAAAEAEAAKDDEPEVQINGGMDNIDLRLSAEANLKALLKDADAAKFRNMFLSRIGGGNLMLCGQVNSKNAFGAYTGFKRFVASPNPDAPTLIEGEASGMGAGIDAAFPQAYSAACSNVVERF